MIESFGLRVCRRWVRWYTSSCPASAASDRADEIESDLWEHAADAARRGTSRLAFDVDVLRRVLSGVPADLSWRRGILRSQPRSDSRGEPLMSRTRQMAETLTVVVAAVAVLPAVSLWPLLGTGDNGALSANEIAWILAATGLGMALLAGLVLRLREQSPRFATGLMAIGAPAPAMAWFWLPPLYLLSAVLLLLTLMTHPRRSPAVAA